MEVVGLIPASSYGIRDIYPRWSWAGLVDERLPRLGDEAAFDEFPTDSDISDNEVEDPPTIIVLKRSLAPELGGLSFIESIIQFDWDSTNWTRSGDLWKSSAGVSWLRIVLSSSEQPKFDRTSGSADRLTFFPAQDALQVARLGKHCERYSAKRIETDSQHGGITVISVKSRGILISAALSLVEAVEKVLPHVSLLIIAASPTSSNLSRIDSPSGTSWDQLPTRAFSMAQLRRS
ncbi:hypothetical protein B0H19DRAFT_1080722 [Mycena capillaripes]|nr:hypothetical protein B0H19DRAFT_1080722 [Mycena capillaripes]